MSKEPKTRFSSPGPDKPFLGRHWFQRPVLEVARDLIGCQLQWRGVSGIIVETEAYAAVGDEASHIFTRPSTRAFMKQVPAGSAYVYFNYGIHWMLNIVALPNPEELLSPENGLILFRALEPLEGIGLMAERRGNTLLRSLCSGPAKLTQALGVTGADHGLDLCLPDGEAGIIAASSPPLVATDRRIGISRAAELPWRFLMEGSAFLSKPLQGARAAR